MRRFLLTISFLVSFVIVADAQQAGRPRKVPTRPPEPCNARDFVQADDTGINSICSYLTLTWNPLNTGATIPSQTGNSGKYLTTNGSALSWGTLSFTPAGSDKHVQFNDGGAFGGVAQFTFAKPAAAETGKVTITGTALSPTAASDGAAASDILNVTGPNGQATSFNNNLSKGGTGSGYSFVAGDGGINSDVNTNPSANHRAGFGGSFLFQAGNGGAATTAPGVVRGGLGGSFTFGAGIGGAAVNGIAGNGGPLSLSAGNGGVSTAAAASGNGGAVTISPGQGGSNSNAAGTAGSGGSLNLDAGSSGAAAGGAAAGTKGSINLGTSNAVGINIGNASSTTTFTGGVVIPSASNLNTPTTLTLTNATGLPVAGLSNLGSNVGTFLITPSSANLRSALTDENGSGVDLFDSSTGATFNTPVFTGLPTGSGVASAGTASTLASRDANANITANNWLGGYTTTTTAAGTTTLTVASTYIQFFTGATTQTITLPVTSTLTLGHQFVVNNNSSGAVTINSSGGNAVVVVAGGTSTSVTCILTSGTSAASWSASYFGDVVASGKKLTVSNSLTITATDGSTLAVGTGGTMGSAAYQNTGTSGANIPFLNGTNTWSAVQTFSSAPLMSTLTSGRVTFATTSGGLTDDADMTFATDTLTVTKLAFAQGLIKSGTTNVLNVRNVADSSYTSFAGASWRVYDASDNAQMTMGFVHGMFATVSDGGVTWGSNTTQSNSTIAAVLSSPSAGIIQAGTTTTNSSGTFKALAYTTDTNCSDSAGAAACGSASAGAFVIDAASTSTVVSTTSVTANSEIDVHYDSSLGTRLSVTCNTTVALPVVTARSAGTSFTVTVPVAPVTNPGCYSYRIVN